MQAPPPPAQSRAMPPRPPIGARLLAHDAALGRLVAGADEAGRGALAGPLVAAAVRFDHLELGDGARQRLEWLDDSKRLSAARREALAQTVLEVASAVSVVVIAARVIDDRGIQVANLGALSHCLALVAPEDCVRLVDGFSLGAAAPEHRRIVRGDQTSAAIAAASVIAKTTRDRLMTEAAARHPGYGFEGHMGYPTNAHRQAIRDLGLSPFHRRSFCSRLLAGD